MLGVLYPYGICAYALWAPLMLTKVGGSDQNFDDIRRRLRHTAKKSGVFLPFGIGGRPS